MIFQFPKDNFPKDFLRIYKNLRNKKILGRIVPRFNFPDEPQFYQYVCERLSNLEREIKAFGYGCSEIQGKAFKIAVAEAVEHYCILYERDDLFIKDTYKNLGNSAVTPLLFIPFTKKQFSKKIFNKFLVTESTLLNWLEGFSLTTKKKVLVPASLVYANYNHRERQEPIIQLTNSNGAACGNTGEFAIYKGICEIIERDAYLISFVNNLPKKIVTVENDKELFYFKRRIERYELEIFFLETRLDFSLPTIACLVIDRSGSGPAVCAGLGGDSNQREAIKTSAFEAIRRHISNRDRFFRSNPLPTPKKNTYDWFLLKKQQLWTAPHMIKTAESFLFGEKEPFKDAEKKFPETYEEKVRLLVEELNTKGLEVIFVDVTVPKVKEEGLHVVKVIIPGMVPLWKDERYPYFGVKRLYEVPKKMGYNPKAFYKKEEAFKIHPF